MPRLLSSLVVIMLAMFVAAGCQTTTYVADSDETDSTETEASSTGGDAAETPESQRGPVRMVLMPTDIELYEMTAAGLLDPKADWTAAAQNNVLQALEEDLAKRNVTLVSYVEPPAGSDRAYLYTQLGKLHGEVGNTIIAHGLTDQARLPTKKDKFDWTLGTDARVLSEDTGAEYAMFVFIRDSYASAERAATMVAVAFLSLGNVVMSGGVQVGFASLVELETGDVQWFNIVRRGAGDIRTLEPARETVEQLLKDIPL